MKISVTIRVQIHIIYIYQKDLLKVREDFTGGREGGWDSEVIFKI